MAGPYISSVNYNNTVYNIKDAEARQAIENINSFEYLIAWKGDSTPDVTKIPAGVVVKYNGTDYTGTLVASSATQYKIYLVYNTTTLGYAEWITIDTNTSGSGSAVYAWEKFGDTNASLGDLGGLAYKDQASNVSPLTTDSVLGADTTFTNASSSVTFGSPTTDTFVKSYPGSTKKLETTSITGTNGTESVSQVTATAKTATNTVFGTDVSASLITTTSKTATNTVFGDSTTASKATAGTSVSVAKTGTAVSFHAFNSSLTNVAYNVAMGTGANAETLIIDTVSTASKSVTPAVSNGTITPYTFADVTVPVVTSNDSETFDAVATLSSVAVPVVSSNNSVTADKVSITNVNVAKVASSATVVATGKVASSDTNGDSVLIGLGTASTGSAVTAMPTATADAQTITVGTNDLVDAVTQTTVTVQ